MGVAPTSIGDEELAGSWIALGTDLRPPRLDRGDGEHWRVVVCAHAYEAIVGRDIVDAVRDRLADRGARTREVVEIQTPLPSRCASSSSASILCIASPRRGRAPRGTSTDSKTDAVRKALVEATQQEALSERSQQLRRIMVMSTWHTYVCDLDWLWALSRFAVMSTQCPLPSAPPTKPVAAKQ